MKLLMSTKPQFKMYLDEELIERLNKAATRFSRESKQSVVEEIVRIYLPTWIAVNDSMRRAVEFQIQQNPPESERTVNATIGVPVAPRSRSQGIPLINPKTTERRSSNAPIKKKNKQVA